MRACVWQCLSFNDAMGKEVLLNGKASTIDGYVLYCKFFHIFLQNKLAQ